MIGVLVITLGRIVRFPSGRREDVLVPFIPAEEVTINEKTEINLGAKMFSVVIRKFPNFQTKL